MPVNACNCAHCKPTCSGSPTNTEPPYYPPYAIGVDGISFCIKSIDIANNDAFGDELYFSVVLDDGPFYTKAKKDAGDGGTLDPFVKVGVLNVQPDNDPTDIIATVDINARFIVSEAGEKYQLIATAVYEGATYVLFNTDVLGYSEFIDIVPAIMTLTDTLDTAVGGTDEGGAIGANAVIKEIVCLMNVNVVGMLLKFTDIVLATDYTPIGQEGIIPSNPIDGVTIPLIGASRIVRSLEGIPTPSSIAGGTNPNDLEQQNGEYAYIFRPDEELDFTYNTSFAWSGGGAAGTYTVVESASLRAHITFSRSGSVGNITLSVDGGYRVNTGNASHTFAYPDPFLPYDPTQYGQKEQFEGRLFTNSSGGSVIGSATFPNQLTTSVYGNVTTGTSGNVTVTVITSTMKIDGADDTTGLSTPDEFDNTGGSGSFDIVSSDGGPFKDWYTAVTSTRMSTGVVDISRSPDSPIDQTWLTDGTPVYAEDVAMTGSFPDEFQVGEPSSDGPDRSFDYVYSVIESPDPSTSLNTSIVFVRITSATSGTGNATVTYDVDANDWGIDRTVYIRVNNNYAIQIKQSA